MLRMEKETLWSYNLLDAQKEKRIYHSYSFWLIVVLHYNFLFVGNFLRILQPRFSIPCVFENLNFKITCLWCINKNINIDRVRNDRIP